uniref:Uncharacterized protein n=1 Tax=Schistocephalus solidus TaxID=70667 RepID=A0A0X3PL77_SCHSO
MANRSPRLVMRAILVPQLCYSGRLRSAIFSFGRVGGGITNPWDSSKENRHCRRIKSSRKAANTKSINSSLEGIPTKTGMTFFGLMRVLTTPCRHNWKVVWGKCCRTTHNSAD